MELETAGHLSDHGPIHSHHVSDKRDAHTLQEELKRQRAEEVIQRAIDRINANPDIPESKKAELRERLLGALNAGDLSSVALIMANVAAEVKTQEAKDEVADLNMVLHETYPGYTEYSYEGRKFIRQQQEMAFERSPELRELKKQYEALPEEDRKAAESEQQENQKRIAEMLHGPNKERYKEFHEDLRILRSTGIGNGPEGKEILDAIANGASPKEFHAKVHEALQRHAAQNDAFVNDYVHKIPKESETALMKEFGADGHMDTAKFMVEWGKLKNSEKDAAYRALAEAGNDVSKLPPEQQRIIHMAQVGIALETKSTIDGAMQIIARDQNLAQQLQDPNVSVEQKMALLKKQTRELGLPEDSATNAALRQTVLAINETVSEGGYDAKNSAEFLKNVGKNIKENYDEMFSRNGQNTDVTKGNYSYQDFSYYNAIAQSDYVPEWTKNNKDYSEQYQQQAQKWQALEDQYRKDYGYGSANMRALEEASMKTLDAQKKDGEVPLAPTASLREFENQSMAKMEQQQAETTAAKPTFVLPPGIDPADLKSLAASGVSSPQEAFQASEKTPSNQQNTQVAEVQVGSRLG